MKADVPAASPAPRLRRETFSSSRLLEFCSIRELTAQIGHGVDDWVAVIEKELIDNAIDIAEEASIAPEVAIEISTERGEIIVADNGPGIRAESVDSIIDYTSRTSSRAGYVSPSRGQQGNALQTIIAMPFALDGGSGETIIEARGIAHRIRFTADPVRQEPRLACDRASSSVRNGTRVTVRWPAKACDVLAAAKDRFLPLVRDFAGLNPHLTITGDWDCHRLVNWAVPCDPNWEKWRPSDPIPPHWYTAETLQRLVAACVNRDIRNGVRVRSIRDFVGTFRGISSTTKRSAVLAETDLARAPLSVFFNRDEVDCAGIARLLTAMQDHSRPVKPEALGVIGEDNWRETFGAIGGDLDGFKYSRIFGDDDSGMPFIVEAAFAACPSGAAAVIAGINWSPALSDPFRRLGPHTYSGLANVLSRQRALNESVLVGVHIASPVATFVDRGKSAIALDAISGEAVADAVRKVTKSWAAAREAAERAAYRGRRAAERQEDEHRKEERAKRRRQHATVVGTGVLYQEIAAAAERLGVSTNALAVLSDKHDPYLRDTTEGHHNGQWFAEQLNVHFPSADSTVHLRGLFYRIVSVGNVRRPDGSPFVNDLECWLWLQKDAAKAARWLGYVPFERLRDERNEPPRLISYADTASAGHGALAGGIGIEIPDLTLLLPRLLGTCPSAPQPYRIILVGEKSSLAEVLEPIALQVKGELLLPTGEASDTMIAEAAARAAADPRPSVVLYFTDFDPSGHQMAHSLARKLQALRRLRYPDLQIEVHQTALTRDQVRRLELPSTPLKQTEKRALKWRARMGHEQTEIDALAALRPDELRRIALDAVAPLFDFMLDARCAEALEKWRVEAQRKLDEHPAWTEIKTSMQGIYEDVEAAANALTSAQNEALAKLKEGETSIASIEIVAPEVEITAKPPTPLFTTADDFITASRKLIASKALDDLAEEGEP